MGYLHIENLYKNQDVLMFKEVYAMEKIHGTSAHISMNADGDIRFFSGGVKHATFEKLWGVGVNHKVRDSLYDGEKLLEGLKAIGTDVTIYGEAYGGSCQKMSETYGTQLRFVAFDVKIGDCWLSVPQAEEIALAWCGLEFVWYTKSSTEIDELNMWRDKPSEQARRNGIEEDKIMEGVVLRPLVEMTKNNDRRIIVKHKRDDFKETKTKREVSPEKLKVLSDAKAVAEEWCTPMRLEHVLDKLGYPGIEKTSDVIRSMIEDVQREGEGEIVWSKEVSKVIGGAAALMFKQRL